MPKLTLPRWVHHLWAEINGYFWKPCSMCGKYFGGHEWAHGYVMVTWSISNMVCKACNPAAERYNNMWALLHLDETSKGEDTA